MNIKNNKEALMQKIIFILVPVIGVVMIGGYLISGSASFTRQSENSESLTDSQITDGDVAETEDSMAASSETGQPTLTGDANNSAESDVAKYQEYSSESFAAAGGARRVLFFHAAWCPTCKVTDADFVDAQSRIPEGVMVFKTDYDTEDELKKKCGVTYQHTFVEVDAQGKQLQKWNGGGVSQLTAKLNK